MSTKTIVRVGQDPDKPVERAVLAQAIVDISKAARVLAAGGLSRKAIVVLVSYSAKVPRSTVRGVLDALEQLEGEYCR